MKKLLLIAMIFVMLMGTGVADAHRLIIVHRINQIEIEAYFGGESACSDAKVSIYTIKDGVEEPYLNGTADVDGKFTFPPKIGYQEYRVVVDSVHLPGHRGDEVINIGVPAARANEDSDGLSQDFLMVISGLGYIVGIAGIAIWYNARKREND